MGAKKNYVGHNSKYVRHISKYLRHIFPPLKTARKLRRFVRTNTDSAFLLIGQHAKIYYGHLMATFLLAANTVTMCHKWGEILPVGCEV